MELQQLETERLILKKFSPEELGYLFENYKEAEIRKLLGHETDEAFEKEKRKYENGYTTYNRSFVSFQMIDKRSGLIIGGCGFHNWFFEHRRAEIGYHLTKEEFKKLGLMSEAVHAVLEYGFHAMNLHRIEAFVGTQNTASQKIMAKYAFEKEGMLRDHYFVDGTFEDSYVYSKIRI